MLLGVGMVGQNIRRLRLGARYKTGIAFAKALGVPSQRVSDWERGRYVLPDTASLIQIAKTLNVSIDQIVEGYDAQYDAITRDSRKHGPPPPPPLSDEQQLLLEAWPLLPDHTRKILFDVLKSYVPRRGGRKRA